MTTLWDVGISRAEGTFVFEPGFRRNTSLGWMHEESSVSTSGDLMGTQSHWSVYAGAPILCEVPQIEVDRSEMSAQLDSSLEDVPAGFALERPSEMLLIGVGLLLFCLGLKAVAQRHW